MNTAHLFFLLNLKNWLKIKNKPGFSRMFVFSVWNFKPTGQRSGVTDGRTQVPPPPLHTPAALRQKSSVVKKIFKSKINASVLGRLPGHASWAPRVTCSPWHWHVSLPQLTQCDSVEIIISGPYYRALTPLPRPARSGGPLRDWEGRNERDQEIERRWCVKKKKGREENDEVDEWIWDKWETQFSSSAKTGLYRCGEGV